MSNSIVTMDHDKGMIVVGDGGRIFGTTVSIADLDPKNSHVVAAALQSAYDLGVRSGMSHMADKVHSAVHNAKPGDVE